MVSEPNDSYFKEVTFPIAHNNNFKEQAKRAGLMLQSKITVDDEYICEDCVKAGRIDFRCDLCGLRYPTTEIHKAIGYPADYLCKNCYETTSAKDWDLKVEALEDSNLDDFE